jgi:hypothetical protein
VIANKEFIKKLSNNPSCSIDLELTQPQTEMSSYYAVNCLTEVGKDTQMPSMPYESPTIQVPNMSQNHCSFMGNIFDP